MTTRELRNFINGEYVDARGDRSLRRHRPGDRGGLRDLARVRRGGCRCRVRAPPPQRLRGVGRDHPGRAPARAVPHRRRHRGARRGVRRRSSRRTPASRARRLVDDEILLSVDQIRFFAGAARNLEGTSAGEYMKDHTSFIRREPIGVDRAGDAVELPAQHGGVEDRPGDRRGQHHGAEALATRRRSSTLLLAEVAAEFLPPGVLNVITGDRTTGARDDRPQIPQMVSITGSVRAGMEVATRRSQRPQARAPRARRQGARRSCSTTPTSRRPSRASRSPATSTPARTARRPPACSCTRASTTSSSRRWPPTRRTTRRPAHRDEDDILFGPVNNANQLERRCSGFIDALPDHATVELGGTARATGATSTRRRSCQRPEADR